jgi:hypothetical protein
MNVVKSLIALAALILLSQTVQAAKKDCIDRLMSDANFDSATYSIHSDDLDRDFGKDHLASAIYTIRLLIDQKGCSRSDINFGKGPLGRSRSRCTKLVGNQDHTRVCYVETNLGYFFLTTDLLDTVNITYSRWD